MPLIRVQAKGQMTVPRAIREAVGITTGTTIWCAQTDEDAFECRVLPDPVDLRAYLDSHIFPGVGPGDDQIDSEVEEGIISANPDLG